MKSIYKHNLYFSLKSKLQITVEIKKMHAAEKRMLVSNAVRRTWFGRLGNKQG